jgi:two-component system alkaline phosphatase synthesis response regulator PhoP
MSDQQILVVEDEENLAEALKFNLERQGYQVIVKSNGYDALNVLQQEAPHLIVLDVMLPGLDGFEVCRRVRTTSNVPILMLTARGEEVDRVLGLEIGADDYLTKPFSLRELQARVRALLRRGGGAPPDGNGEAMTAGNLNVSQLLVFLMRNRGLALSRRQLLDGAWGSDFVGDERTVDVHMRALREAVENDPHNPVRIVTVRGIGYRFEG